MKLYKVRYEIDLMIVADTPDAAVAVALDGEWAGEIYHGAAYADEVTGLCRVPHDWQGSVPWGSEDNKTCVELLEEKP